MRGPHCDSVPVTAAERAAAAEAAAALPDATGLCPSSTSATATLHLAELLLQVHFVLVLQRSFRFGFFDDIVVAEVEHVRS
jgi:hypothetical protein